LRTLVREAFGTARRADRYHLVPDYSAAGMVCGRRARVGF
jgi:hypothetical protein